MHLALPGRRCGRPGICAGAIQHALPTLVAPIHRHADPQVFAATAPSASCPTLARGVAARRRRLLDTQEAISALARARAARPHRRGEDPHSRRLPPRPGALHRQGFHRSSTSRANPRAPSANAGCKPFAAGGCRRACCGRFTMRFRARCSTHVASLPEDSAAAAAMGRHLVRYVAGSFLRAYSHGGEGCRPRPDRSAGLRNALGRS